MKAMVVDRADLRHFAAGELLHFQRGNGFAINEEACAAAVSALENGEDVLLTEGGKLTGTKMVVQDGAYMEVRV